MGEQKKFVSFILLLLFLVICSIVFVNSLEKSNEVHHFEEKCYQIANNYNMYVQYDYNNNICILGEGLNELVIECVNFTVVYNTDSDISSYNINGKLNQEFCKTNQ